MQHLPDSPSTPATAPSATESPSRRSLGWSGIVAAALAYTVLCLGAVYSAIGSWGSQMIGGSWDSGQNLWNFWWIELSARAGDFFPFHTDVIYYPQGVSLAYHTLDLLDGYVGLALRALTGMSLPASFNTVVLLASIIGAFSAFLLARYVTKSVAAGFVAGTIFAYSPYVLSRMHFGHLGVFVGMQLIPLVFLLILRGLQTSQLRYPALAAVTAASMGWASLSLLPEIGLVGSLLIILFGFRSLRPVALTRHLAVFVLLTGLLVLPVTLPMIRDYTQFADQQDMARAAVANAPDLLNFFLPDRSISAFWREAMGRISDQPLTDFYQIRGQRTVFVGLAVLVLAALAAVAVPLRKVWRWWLVGGLSFLLTLGPVLNVGGRQALPTMPYAWLSAVPFVGLGREPTRWEVFLGLALAVVIATFCATLAGRSRWMPGLIVLLGLVVYGEFLAVPVRLDDRLATTPPFYQTLAQTTLQGGVMEVPYDLLGAPGPACDYMVYQIVHQKPIASGYISRAPTSASNQFQAFPFIKQLRARIYDDREPVAFTAQLIAGGEQELRAAGIEVVILHKGFVPEGDARVLESALTQVLLEPTYQDNQVVVWRLPY